MATATAVPAIPNIVSLYGGAIRIRPNPKSKSDAPWIKSPRYLVSEWDGPEEPVWSVTQILEVLNKPALVQWAANCAAAMFRQNVQPGVALDELQITALYDDIRFNFRKVSKEAADIGTLVHGWIKGYAEGKVTNFPFHQQARTCCEQAKEWIDGKKWETPSIIDYKSSKGIWAEYRFQVAAYKCALEEELRAIGSTGINATERMIYSRKYKFAGTLDACSLLACQSFPRKGYDRWVVRLDKEGNGIEPLKLPAAEYKSDLNCFLACQKAHVRLKQLEAA